MERFPPPRLVLEDSLSNYFMDDSNFLGSYLHKFLLGILEAIGEEVDGLHLGDGVLLQAGGEWIQRPHLWLVCQAVLEGARCMGRGGRDGIFVMTTQ